MWEKPATFPKIASTTIIKVKTQMLTHAVTVHGLS